MGGLWQCGAGLALAVFGWLLPRWVAGAGRLGWAAPLDAAPIVTVVLLLFLATGRPVYAGAIAFALGGGFAFADRTVRDTLRDPVLFSALSELPQIFTHPHLYLPFAGTGLVIGAVGATLLAGLALLVAEPAVTTPPADDASGVLPRRRFAMARGYSPARQRAGAPADPTGEAFGAPRGWPCRDPPSSTASSLARSALSGRRDWPRARRPSRLPIPGR